MPTVFRTNNRVTPANNRAADVAERAVQEIVPLQQRRYYNAFRVQGIEVVAYNRLTQGRKCSCKASGKQINGILNEEGKASPADINRIITGGMEFDMTPYDMGYEVSSPDKSSVWDSHNQYQGVWDRMASPTGEAFSHETPGGPDVFGDDGPKQKVDINELLNENDNSTYGTSDVSCAICFGTGFVGGYSASHSYRHVIPANDVVSDTGTLDLLARPLAVLGAKEWTQKITLPRGAVSVDSTKVWNNFEPVPGRWFIDGAPILTDKQFLSFCDGKAHLFRFVFAQNSDFTHIELQFAMTDESLYFEFPRRSSSSNTALLERMEPFQIVMSPNIQRLSEQDVIVENQMGKVLLVQNVNDWHTRQMNVLGPECRVRVIQPQEPFRILPSRGRITQQKVTNMVRENQNGVYKT